MSERIIRGIELAAYLAGKVIFSILNRFKKKKDEEQGV